MTGYISFVIEESYRKVGFGTHDDFTVTISNLTENESQWLRGQILLLISERGGKS